MGSKPVQLKVFIDKKKNKVLFAEAEQDFVEILFSFLTLPLGTIARHSRNHEKDMKVGSLDSLYESVANLDNKHFTSEGSKSALINPNNSSLALCQKLKINLNTINNPVVGPVVDANDSHADLVFFKKSASFIITDSLNVLPVMLDTSIGLLNFLDVEYIELLEERTMDFGFEEFSSLLKWSLMTDTPLTNLVLGGSKPCLSCNLPFIVSNSTQRQMTVKLLIQKSKKKVLCAQADNFFVEMLFSFLTIPLGNVLRLTTMDKYSSSTGIDNMYHSILSFGNGKYFKSEEIKNLLLCPKLASTYMRVTDLLPIYEKNKNQGRFLKEQGTYIVSDDLEVTFSPSISKFNTLGVPVVDMEVMEVVIGEPEALIILKASLTSTSALSDCLSLFKNAKIIDLKPFNLVY